MRIVDLRPVAHRGALKMWEGNGVGSAWPPWLLNLTAWPTDTWLAARRRRRPAPAPRPFVVSVGNLALGGTGKTPVASALAVGLAAQGRRGAIVTRGYGSPLAGPLLVAHDTPGAGDEARMLAAQLGPVGWTVVQARRRDRGIRHLLEQDPELDVVILEDGHQNADTGRHLDVVILDAWRECTDAGSIRPVTGPVFPWGPWRESARGACENAIWLLETEDVPGTGTSAGPAVVGFRREYRLEAEVEPARRVALLSGIARPQVFETAAATLLSHPPVMALRCADHEAYMPGVLDRIGNELARAGVDVVVTTAKDRIKLASLWKADPELVTLEMNLTWTGATALPDVVGERLDAVLSGRGR